MKEERMAILRMLENGIISTDEAERLLNILNETREKDVSGNIESAFAKAGNTLENIVGNVGKKAGQVAKVVGDKAEQAKPEIKKAAKTVAEKVTEAAGTIKDDINKRKAAKEGTSDSDFVYEDEKAKEETEDATVDKTNAEDVSDNVIKDDTLVNEEIEKTVGFSQDEDVKTNEELQEDDDDGRDYEAEYYQMMRETNGGDIFGDVYKAMDNLKGIGGDENTTADNTDDNKTDNE